MTQEAEPEPQPSLQDNPVWSQDDIDEIDNTLQNMIDAHGAPEPDDKEQNKKKKANRIKRDPTPQLKLDRVPGRK